jgi:hypothetical protein
MAPTRFGKLCVNDPEPGRPAGDRKGVRRSTVDKIRAFIANYGIPRSARYGSRGPRRGGIDLRQAWHSQRSAFYPRAASEQVAWPEDFQAKLDRVERGEVGIAPVFKPSKAGPRGNARRHRDGDAVMSAQVLPFRSARTADEAWERYKELVDERHEKNLWATSSTTSASPGRGMSGPALPCRGADPVMADFIRTGDEPAPQLPQNVEAEAALLGALMIDNRLVDQSPTGCSRTISSSPSTAASTRPSSKEGRAGRSRTRSPQALLRGDDEAMKEVGGPRTWRS